MVKVGLDEAIGVIALVWIIGAIVCGIGGKPLAYSLAWPYATMLELDSHYR
jgi:hypothetical protein